MNKQTDEETYIIRAGDLPAFLAEMVKLITPLNHKDRKCLNCKHSEEKRMAMWCDNPKSCCYKEDVCDDQSCISFEEDV